MPEPQTFTDQVWAATAPLFCRVRRAHQRGPQRLIALGNWDREVLHGAIGAADFAMADYDAVLEALGRRGYGLEIAEPAPRERRRDRHGRAPKRSRRSRYASR